MLNTGLNTSPSADVVLTVDKPDCLMDEEVTVKVTGLSPNDKVIILATTELKENLFWSHGLFRANSSGDVDLRKDAPISGSYSDADPAGLLWSMVAAPWLPAYTRMFQATAIKPRTINFSVFPESNDPSEYLRDKTKVLATAENRRWYTNTSTRRIPIDHPKLKGTLFLPEGHGPFPGVIDMYGAFVLIVEERAALLSSRGFATLSLSLPQTLPEIDLDYFEEAAEWFASLPEVRSDGIGIMSLCLGGSLAFWMAQHIPNVRAIVGINGIPCAFPYWTHKGVNIASNTRIELARVQFNQEGFLLRDLFVVPDDSYLKPWTHGAHLLTILGLDDLLNSLEHTFHLYDDLMPQDYRKEKAELVTYPGAGHIIDPPYTPVCRILNGFDRFLQTIPVTTPVCKRNNLIINGGYPKEHAAAQKDAWQRSVNFLKKHLC
ncbi:bile acid-CoA:amino acid N-acyltransferase-like [Ylistrum balloti]|uniref:bile acid-CoA:amino acid N-acyltransferase-like n=1 Tax=Ylistrum balloti TaxID=509963 RepID=UPI002905F75E|nr:bile acid-CoA:amino acid N-acyltransferase-like [Ylistrum balloti]